MKITLGKLRSIIQEEVGKMVFIHNAGFGGMSGISNLQHNNKNFPIPGLGDEEEQELEKHGEEQEKSQWTVRVRNRELRT